jgi:hypothetical protein
LAWRGLNQSSGSYLIDDIQMLSRQKSNRPMRVVVLNSVRYIHGHIIACLAGYQGRECDGYLEILSVFAGQPEDRRSLLTWQWLVSQLPLLEHRTDSCPTDSIAGGLAKSWQGFPQSGGITLSCPWQPLLARRSSRSGRGGCGRFRWRRTACGGRKWWCPRRTRPWRRCGPWCQSCSPQSSSRRPS